MAETQPSLPPRKSRYSHADLLRCARGELFGPGNPQLPEPPMLMFDRIDAIAEAGGAHGKGQVIARLEVRKDLWFFGCHFPGDPVMPGCLGLDAMWQLVGFFLGWKGAQGRGRALGVGKVRFSGMVLPTTSEVEYHIDLKRVTMRRLVLAVANGVMKADGEPVYMAEDLRVGVFGGPAAA